MVLRALVVSLLCGIASSYSAPHVEALSPQPVAAAQEPGEATSQVKVGSKITLKGLVGDAVHNGRTEEVIGLSGDKAVIQLDGDKVAIEPKNFDVLQGSDTKLVNDNTQQPVKVGDRITLKGLADDVAHNGRTEVVIGIDQGKAVIVLDGEKVGVEPKNFEVRPSESEKSETRFVEQMKSANDIAKSRLDAATPTTHYVEGTHVVLEGLKTAGYNGKRGVIVKAVPNSRPFRYEVAVDNLYDHLALKEDNIKLLSADHVVETAEPKPGHPTMDQLRQLVLPAGQYIPSEEKLLALEDDQLRDMLREVMVENQVLRAQMR